MASVPYFLEGPISGDVTERRFHKIHDIRQVARSFEGLNWLLPKHLELDKQAQNLSLVLKHFPLKIFF